MVLPCGLVCTQGALLAAPPTAAWVPVNNLQDPFLEGSFLAPDALSALASWTAQHSDAGMSAVASTLFTAIL